MLRKHNKLIMLLVLVTFMFTMVGSAGAATYSDVSGTSIESSAIYRLSGLGVLDGYPDGTFGPEKTITRAEFAKIACVTAGLKSVASGMGGTASPFSDVAIDHWANGWVNVAAAQGFVKGDPAGTFRPEDNITQAEVVTVLLRLLGYNDNLPGEWPSDYISKAANLGILDDITFVATQDATRGTVAILTSANLDEKVVDYRASDNLFIEATKDGKTYTLLADKFKDTAKYKNILAMSFTYKNDAMYLQYLQFNEDQDKIFAAAQTDLKVVPTGDATEVREMKIGTKCVFPDKTGVLGVIEKFVEFDVNDDNEITSIVAKDYKVIGPKKSATAALDEIIVEGNKAKVDGVKYDFISYDQIAMEAVPGTEFTQDGTSGKVANGTYNKGDAYGLIFNKDGKIVAVRSWTFPTPGIVEKVIGERVYYFDNASPAKALVVNLNAVLATAGKPSVTEINSYGGAFQGFDSQGNFKDEDIFVQRDGVPATLGDIEPLDTLNVLKGYRGYDYYLVATSTKVPGKLARAEYSGVDVKKVNVMGMDWKISYDDFFYQIGLPSYGAVYSIDSGETFEGVMDKETLDKEYDAWDTDVRILPSATGKVAALILGDASAASKMYGVITEISGTMSWTDSTTVRNITVLREDGKEYTYPISKDTYVKKLTVNKKIKDWKTIDTVSSFAPTLSNVETLIQPTFSAGAYDPTVGEKVAGLVGISLKSNGLVDRIEVLDYNNMTLSTTNDSTVSPPITKNLDTDENLVKLGGVWCDASKVVIINLMGATATAELEDSKVQGWKELKEANGKDIYAFKSNNSNVAQFVLMNSAAISSGSKYAIYETQYSSSDDYYKFVGMDAMKVGTAYDGLKKGDVVKYETSGDEVNVKGIAVSYGVGSPWTIKKISGSSIQIENVVTNAKDSFITDSDTVYFDITDKDELKVLESVSVNDVVKVIADGALAKAVVVVDYDVDGPKLLSAAIKDKNTIILTFDEAVDATSIAKADFEVADKVTATTTYAVANALYGPDANPLLSSNVVVLVTADTGASQANGLTVKYTAGTLKDRGGNAAATATATIATW